MSVLIKGVKMPKDGEVIDLVITSDGVVRAYDNENEKIGEAVELPEHGDLIDRDKLNEAMYHEAFETDSEWQKWDSGCWIRYKMFERHRDSAPVVIPAERSGDGDA